MVRICDILSQAIDNINKLKSTPERRKLIEDLDKLRSWCYPGFYTRDIQKVVYCKDCKHYKKYKRKGDPKAASFYACSLTKTKHKEDFYCRDGSKK